MVLRNFGQPWARPNRLGMEKLAGQRGKTMRSWCDMRHKEMETWVRGGEAENESEMFGL